MDATKILNEFTKAHDTLNKAQALLEKLPELTGKYTYTITQMTDTYICISRSLPYIPADFKANREKMEAAGWMKTWEYQYTDDGVYAEVYSNDVLVVNLYYRPTLDGSTCKLNLIGYEQKPVYEVTCMEA